MASSIGIDSTVIVEPAGLATSSVSIDSTASRVTGYLSKSRSKRISESLLVEVIALTFSANLVFRFENPRGRDVFLPRSQSRDAEVICGPNATLTNFTPRPSSANKLACPAFNRRT
ncbi:hypothetical protein ACFXTO_032346 [Malus domestica]